MDYIIGYYLFTFQQYVIHKIQHTCKICTIHRIQHHQSYDRNDITKLIKKNTLYQNLDLYLYGNIVCMCVNIIIFDINIIILQIFLGYLSYYFHNQYHTPNSIWKHYSIFKYLKNKHQIHHRLPSKNHSLLDPTFDIIFNTYK